MLRITTEQMAVLDGRARRDFVALHGPRLAASFPELAVHEQWWADALDKAVEEAVGFGVDSERAVLRFLELRLTYGTDFPAGPDWAWARRILEAAPPTGDHKIEQIDEVVCGGALW